MKLCYLSSSQLPSRAANSVHVMKICEAFAGLGHRVTLYGKASKLDEDLYSYYGVAASFTIRSMPRWSGTSRRAWLRLVLGPQVAWLRPDIIYGRSARALRRITWLGIPFVFEAHLLPTSAGRRKEQEALFAASSFRRLVVISGLLRDDYLSEFPALDPAQVVVAHDAASPVSCSVPSPGSGVEPSQRAGSRPQVGYVGHLYPGKGMETIHELAGRCPWADFHVYGGAEQDLDSWRPRVAGSSNLELHGFITHAEVGRRIESFDIVLAPYGQKVIVQGGGVSAERWMSPLKIFEYMSHGKPIVATDLPVIREVLEPERNALLAPAGDLEAWERCLRRLTDQPELRQRLGQRAREDFAAHHTWSARAQAVLAGL